MSLLFKLSSLLFFQVFDDLGINFLKEIIGLSQYLFDLFVFISLLHDIAFLPDYRLLFHEIFGSWAQLLSPSFTHGCLQDPFALETGPGRCLNTLVKWVS